MKKPKIFTATFEESLNFEDDALLNWQNKDIKNSNAEEKSGLLFIITIVLILFLYGIHLLAKNVTIHHYRDSPIPKADINFLPFRVFLIFFALFVIFWVYTHLIRFKMDHLFWAHVNSNNIYIWLMLEINLMFVTMLFKSLRGWGILIIYLVLASLTLLLIHNQNKSIKRILFSSDEEVSQEHQSKSRIIKYISGIGGLAFIIYIILKIIFPEIVIMKNGLSGFIMIISLWIIINIVFLVIEVYVELPFQLQGYYKRRYSEKYRNWENKSQLEWYGDRYFEKHIKGTDVEESSNDLSKNNVINIKKFKKILWMIKINRRIKNG